MDFMGIACKVFLCYMLYLFNKYNCVWFAIMDYFFYFVYICGTFSLLNLLSHCHSYKW